MPLDPANFVLAAVRAPPASWPMPIMNKDLAQGKFDLDATTDIGINLIKTAAARGAGLVTFPECWFPGYPRGIQAEDPSKHGNDFFINHVASYVEQSLVIGSSQWKKIAGAVQDCGIYVALGFSEREGDLCYMAQALLGPDGEILIHRRKLRPSGIERLLWSDGTVDGFQVADTPFGRIGMLECAEHGRPSMLYPMHALGEDIHVGAWPLTPDLDTNQTFWEDSGTILALARAYAYTSRAVVVVPSVGVAAIFAAGGKVLAHSTPGYNFDTEPIIYASVDTTKFKGQRYNPHGEFSWSVLEQVADIMAEHKPAGRSQHVAHHENSIKQMLENAKNKVKPETMAYGSTSPVE